jgi:hypothetical protein
MMLAREERLKAEAIHAEELERRLKVERQNLGREQKDLDDARRRGNMGRIFQCADVVEKRQRDIAALERKLGLRSASHLRSADKEFKPERYEVVTCERCEGKGTLPSGKMCARCMGQGEYYGDVGDPEQPKKFHTPIGAPNKNKPVDGPARKQGTTPKISMADLERRIAAAERRHGIDPRSGARTSKMRHPRLGVIEKGSRNLVPAAKALAQRENITIETAMIRIAAESPSLTK